MAQLGIRNNNWFNVRHSPDNQWIGQTGGDESDYAKFENPVYGIRAADKVLANYQNLHGIDTISDTINRYAPPSDNNPTDNYINYVSEHMGIDPDERIDLSNPDIRARMMQAMVGFETPDAASQFTPELLSEARGISGEVAASQPRQATPDLQPRQAMSAPAGRRTFTVRDSVSGKTLKLSGTRPPTNADLQRIFAPYRDASGEAGDRTILGQAVETVKAIPRGFGHSILSSVEGAVEVADAATNFIGLDNLIDSGDENELIRLAHAGQESLSTGFLGADEAYQDAWLTKFGEGLGSMASFMTPAGAARLAGLAGKGLRMTESLGAAGLATTMYAGEQAQRIKAAREAGIEVSEGQEDAAVIAGAFAGLTELLPIQRLLSRIPRTAGYTFGQNAMKNITEAIKSGGVEAVQEVVGLWTQNAIERNFYNENLPTGQSMWDEFTIGGAVGMTADLLLTAFSGRRARLSTQTQKDKEAELRRENDEAVADLPNKLSRQLEEENANREVEDASAEEGVSSKETLETVADESEASAVDPKVIQPPFRLKDRTKLPPRGWATEYAKRIAGTMGKDFPSNVNFTVDRFRGQDGANVFAVVSGNNQYGIAQPTKERAWSLSHALNNEVKNDRIRTSVIDILRMSPESYSPSMMGDLYRYGLEMLNPEAHTITAPQLDEAAGTPSTGETVAALDRAGVPLKDRTASQKYNYRRVQRGLPEVTTFTPKEAKQILKDNFKKLPDINPSEETERYSAVDDNGNHYVRSSAGEVIRSRRHKVTGELLIVDTRQKARSLAKSLMDNFAKDKSLIPNDVLKEIKGSVKEIERLLENKNISSSIDSPEVMMMAERMTGKRDVKKMSRAELRMFYQRLRKLPKLSEMTRLPMMRARPYTKLQWDRALDAVKTSGDPSVANIQQAARFIGRKEITKLEQAKALRKDLVDQGVIAKNKVVPYEQEQQAKKAALEAEEKFAEENARRDAAELSKEAEAADIANRGLDDLRAALRKSLDAIGLKEVGINLSERLEFSGRDADGNMVLGARYDSKQGKFLFKQTPEKRTEAYYQPGINAIFLGLDKVSKMDTKKNPMTEEQIRDALTDLMNHESLHAMRKLDLFTEKEWFLLENAARRLKRRDNDKTFYEEARLNYSDQIETIQMEEAIAELIRHGRRDPKLVGGKPRNLIDRVMRFLERVYSAMRGTGYQSYGDIIASLERGEIGGRERGVVRTLLETERQAGKIPERGIGLSDEEIEKRIDQQRKDLEKSRKKLEKEAKKQGVSVEELVEREGAALEAGQAQTLRDDAGLILEARRVSSATDREDFIERQNILKYDTGEYRANPITEDVERGIIKDAKIRAPQGDSRTFERRRDGGLSDILRTRTGRSYEETNKINKKTSSIIDSEESNLALSVANTYNFNNGRAPYVRKSERKKDRLQSAIAQNYDNLVNSIVMRLGTKSPTLEQLNAVLSNPTQGEIDVYNSFLENYPTLMRENDINSYRDLVFKSYQSLEEEVDRQYDHLLNQGIVIEHHDGEAQYSDSKEMAADVHLFNHLWVFRGGGQHPFLNITDSKGLSSNDKFRAVHDYFGHVVNGNGFGVNGEETAFASHSQMFSPLAAFAMAAETRGQNSWVNYSGVNNRLKEMSLAASSSKKRWEETGDARYLDYSDYLSSQVASQWTYAIQMPVMLNANHLKDAIPEVTISIPEAAVSIPDILESRRASRLDERVESGTIEDYASLESVPEKQRAVRDFLEGRRVVVPSDILEARHVSADRMWYRDVGILESPERMISPPRELNGSLTRKAKNYLYAYVNTTPHVRENTTESRGIADALGDKYIAIHGNENIKGTSFVSVDQKKVFRILIDDLIANNESYRNEIKRRLSEAGIPETFTVYRGRSEKDKRGFGKWKDDLVASVSTDRNQAQAFAEDPKMDVIDAYTISYDDILAMGSVAESELIVRLPTEPDSTTQPESKEESEAFLDARDLDLSEAEKARMDRAFRALDILEARRVARPAPTALPAEGIEEVAAQNVREGEGANPGLQPKFSQNASPEAQYVARNPDKGTPLSDSMDIRYSRSASEPSDYGEATKWVDKYSASYVPNAHPILTYIRETEGTWNKIKIAMTALKQRAVNNWARLEAISQDPKLRDLYGNSSAMAAALMSDRSRGLVASALKYGTIVYKDGVMRVVNEKEGTRTKKQLTGMMDGMVSLFSNSDLTGNPDVNLERLAQAYAAAKRESRFDPDKGIVVKVTAKEQADAIAEIQEEVDRYINRETGNPIVEEWYAWWQDYNENTIQWLEDTGVVDADTAEIWRTHATYYPFYEQVQGNPNFDKHKGMQVFAGMTGSAQFERLKGSKNPLDVPLLEAVTRNLSAAIDMGMKNVAQQRIIRDQVEFGAARNITNQPEKHNQVMNVKLMVKGREQIYEIDDPLLHESMLAMGQGDLGWVVNNIFGPASQLLRETVTRDPAFILVNMMRDTMSAYVTSGSNFVPVVDTVKGFFGSDVKELEMLGVVGGYDFSNDPKDVVKFMKRLAAKRGTPIGSIRRKGELDIGGRIEQGFEAPVLKQFKQLWQGMGAATTRSDAATRRAVYDDVLERTGNLGEAQIQALEIINFSRRGNSTLMRTLTAAIPFLNARMQGVDVLYRAFTGRYSANKEKQNMQVIRAAMLRGGSLMALTSIYYLLVSDEDEYKDARPEVRDDYFIVPLKSIGMDTVLRLPTPFEVGVIFKTIPERIIDSMVGDSTSRDVRTTVERAITNTLEINPLQAQAFAPIIETWLNHDFYTGRSIVPMYMDQDVARGLQDTFGTRELAVKIGNALNLSPIKIDHIMTGYAGTLGVYGLDVIDAFMRTEGRIPPERRLDQYPVIKRFFSSPRGGGLQSQFYELNNQVREVVTTMNRLQRQGRYDELNAFLKTRQGILEIRDNVNYISKRMAEYRAQRDQIQRSQIDPATKKEMLELLEAEVNLMLRVAPELKRIADVPAFERVG